jgi:type II secretory pathway predicted ATPase ExeA
MSNHPKPPANAAIIGTRSFLCVQEAVKDIAKSRMIGAVYGDSGLGKTFAVETALRSVEGVRTCQIAAGDRATARYTLQMLWDELTGEEPVGERFKLQRDLRRLLSEEGYLLLIDEAQYMQRNAIEEIRHLHDHRDTDFGVVFCGGDRCRQVLESFPMLRSRTQRWVGFEALDLSEVLQIMPSYHPVFACSTTDVLTEIDERFAQGQWRHWVSFCRDAIDACADAGKDSVDEQVMRDVFARRGGGRAAA